MKEDLNNYNEYGYLEQRLILMPRKVIEHQVNKTFNSADQLITSLRLKQPHKTAVYQLLELIKTQTMNIERTVITFAKNNDLQQLKANLNHLLLDYATKNPEHYRECLMEDMQELTEFLDKLHAIVLAGGK
ncbi:MAG: hypothetical protein N4A41_15010 [Crocinitomicaceae bacterium]|nr:hypothetical protein [Crocinitomicaceae bacterium]